MSHRPKAYHALRDFTEKKDTESHRLSVVSETLRFVSDSTSKVTHSCITVVQGYHRKRLVLIREGSFNRRSDSRPNATWTEDFSMAPRTATKHKAGAAGDTQMGSAEGDPQKKLSEASGVLEKGKIFFFYRYNLTHAYVVPEIAR